MKLLHLDKSVALKQKRLATLRAERSPNEEALQSALEDALAAGSLELAEQSVEPLAVARLRAARRAIAADAPISLQALLAWHAATIGGGAWRTGLRERDGGPPTAPPEFLLQRVEGLVHWLTVDSSRELTASQQGALAFARLVELAPFDDGNGRVARLAASHLMQRAGSLPPLLRGSDGPRLKHTLEAAFQLHTEPLAQLLEDASEHALDLLIETIERA